MKKITRREVLGSGAVALGALILRPRRPGERLRRSHRKVQGESRVEHGAASRGLVRPSAPWELVAPFVPGSAVAFSWRVHALSPIASGSATLTLRHASGREEHIRVLRRGLVPAGIARTDRLDLLLIDGAKGATPTDEKLARVILALAETITAHERAKPPQRVLASLQTLPVNYS